MTAAAAARASSPRLLRRTQRVLRSPKGYLLLALVPLAVIAAPDTGFGPTLRTIAAAIPGATLMEAVLVRRREGRWRLSLSPVLSGLIIAMVLSAQEPWYVAARAGVLAADTKQLLRVGRRHVFNPAALALALVYLLFGSGQSWWGALANLPLPAALLVVLAGAVVARRANKLPAALSFLGAYLLVCTSVAFLGHAAAVADLYRQPFVGMALFFGFLMVTDPPTSPVTFPGQMGFGAIVALASAAVYLASHSLVFLPAGLVLGNGGYAAVWQASHLRRSALRRRLVPSLPADRRSRTPGLAAAASAVALILVIGASAVALRRAAHTGDDAATTDETAAGSPSSASAQGGRFGAASAPFSAFDDSFTGTVAQHPVQDGIGIDLDVIGTGARPVRLAMHLTGRAVGRGQVQIDANRATLFDATGSLLCQGQVTALSAQAFAVACQGQGAYRGAALQIQGTITDVGDGGLAGDLHVAAAED